LEHIFILTSYDLAKINGEDIMGLLNLKTVQYLTIIFCCSFISNYKEARASSTEKNLNTGGKTYYVKGMTCGGCIFSVKNALDGDSNSIGFSEKKVNVGTVTLKFKTGNYKGGETDCKIKKSIESKTEYTVFQDFEYKMPLCNNKIL
jgi:copper chaperone CopZ